MRISGINKLTLLDFPGHTACTIFIGGCNFVCPFCQNASLVLHPETEPSLERDEIMAFLKKRRGILEGVCVTGGEPTLAPELSDFIAEIKSLGFAVKLDTNGTNPSVIRKLLDAKLLDYVAMDIKNSPERYAETVGLKNLDINKLTESISLIRSAPDYEFRTTVAPELQSENDIEKIGKWIQGAKRAFLQAYRDGGDIIAPSFTAPSSELLHKYKIILSHFVGEVGIRGI